MIYWIGLFGTFVFAISGILTSTDKRFDLVGTIVIGVVTALGGGTLRDMMIGATPVQWMMDDSYLAVIFLALATCFFLKKHIEKLRRSFFIFDTIGIGLFTILGINKSLEFGLPPASALIMGIVSAVFGGIIRDVLSNEVPLIFRKEIYASACFAGGLLYLVLRHFDVSVNINMVMSISLVILIRGFSSRYGWTLPFKPL